MDPVEREMLAKKVKKKLDFILLPMVSAHTSWHTISSKLIPCSDVLRIFLELHGQELT
jgi:hypothetical protein